MKVYIMRHGEASFNATSDAARPLTAGGKQQCLSIANWLKQQQISFDLGLVSPYLRAQQTYSIIAEQLTIRQTQVHQQLTPSGHSETIVNELLMLLPQSKENILIVSHLPLVGYLVSDLCPQLSPPMFSTADLACVNLQNDVKGLLEWVQHP